MGTKTCPRCTKVSPAYALRCTCGYDFDMRGEERSLTLEEVARQEILFEQYLSARYAQAIEAAKVAARAADFDPADQRKAVEALRANQAVSLAEAELEMQRARARQAAQAAGLDRAWLLRTDAAIPTLSVTLAADEPSVGPFSRKRVSGRRVAGPPAARRPARRSVTAELWKRAVTKTVIRAAKTTAKTTSIVAKAAKNVVGAATRGATQAVKAAQQKRRRMVRATAKLGATMVAAPARPTPSPVVAQQPLAGVWPPPPAKVQMPRNGVAPGRRPLVRIAKKGGAPAPLRQTVSVPQDRAGPPLAATRTPPEPKQSAVPSQVFRVAQARKIAQALAAARALDSTPSGFECPLCSARLRMGATRCRCGWRVAADERDMPALEPLTPPRPAAAPSNGAEQCPYCTTVILPGAARCKCGWQVPTTVSELQSVSLSADERFALSTGLEPTPRGR